jgi:hypothetical protein
MLLCSRSYSTLKAGTTQAVAAGIKHDARLAKHVILIDHAGPNSTDGKDAQQYEETYHNSTRTIPVDLI